jgi:hypothetical protein
LRCPSLALTPVCQSRRHQTALRDQAVCRSRQTTATMSQVAPQKPLRATMLAWQVGELDPVGDESRQATSAASRAARGVGDLAGSASAQLDVGSARGQPRRIHKFVHAPSPRLREGLALFRSRSAAWGPIQSQRGRACDAGVSLWDRRPISCDTPECVRPFMPQFGVQLSTPGRESFTSYPTRLPPWSQCFWQPNVCRACLSSWGICFCWAMSLRLLPADAGGSPFMN